VQKQALEVANRTIAKLTEMNKELAEELSPKFKEEPKWNGIFKLDLSSKKNIPINKRGSGVRRLILLNFFRAEAERLREEKHVSDVIFALEEPETSQHPSNQEMIINALLEISHSGKSQVLLTTHVPGLASLLPLDSVRFLHCEKEELQCKIEEPSEQVYKLIADSLGVLPYEEGATAKAIIMVEGPDDVMFIKHLAMALKGANKIIGNLDDFGIVPLIAGGCSQLKYWVNLGILKKLNKPYLCFVDSDRKKPEDHPGDKHSRRLQREGVNIFYTRKREVENYLCPSVVDNVQEIGDFDDVKKIAGKNILKNKWPMMTADKILSRDKYIDENGNEQNELLELMEEVIGLVNMRS
ncbi:MAG: ATP-binding protein, partial [Nanoarchaeota archaeon]|nr:ATP-binding protein [Nanoarchaeota archaeon]